MPLDPVARFHLGNGARLERHQLDGRHAPRKALQQSFGMMVNYVYRPRGRRAQPWAATWTRAARRGSSPRGWRRATPTLLLRKTASDSFHLTGLQDLLRSHGVTSLVVCGMQSDFCVDTTTRRALALGYPVVLVADGHTTLDNRVLAAAQIVAHHNETLANLESFGPRVLPVPAAQVRIDG